MAAWPADRAALVADLQASQLWWYRQHYRIPRHDPRLVGLTAEELDLEYRTWCAQEQIDPDAPGGGGAPDAIDAYMEAVQAGTLDPRDDAARQAFIAEWRAAHPEAAPPRHETPYAETSFTEAIKREVRAQVRGVQEGS